MRNLLLTVLFLAMHDAAAAPETAVEIMKKNFLSTKVKDSKSESVFRLIDPKGNERTRKTIGFTRLIDGTTDSMRLVAFLTPPDIKNTKTLMIEHSGADDDIWVYLPAMKKVRRLLANNKKDSFVGTDFAYGDVIGYKVDEWNHKIIKEENLGDKKCYVIESIPKTPNIANSYGYSKRISWIDQETSLLLKGHIFDQTGQLLKEMTAEKMELVDKKQMRWQPMLITAANVQTGRKTIVEFKSFKANIGVPKTVFTPGFLEKN